MEKPLFFFKKLHQGVNAPAKKSPGASGHDVEAFYPEVKPGTIVARIQPGKTLSVPIGLAFECPLCWEIEVTPRSGIAKNHGITVLNSPGTIDSDYRGEVHVILVNHSDQPFFIRQGDRIAQLKFKQSPVVELQELVIAELSATERGTGGFNSTGLNDADLKVSEPVADSPAQDSGADLRVSVSQAPSAEFSFQEAKEVLVKPAPANRKKSTKAKTE